MAGINGVGRRRWPKGERRSASASTRLSRRLNGKIRRASWRGLISILGNAICQQLQAKCVWVESNFDGIIPALKARKFDAILSGMYMTEKRKAQIAFSDKLYNGPVFLVARKNTLQGNTPEQLKGKTIDVEQGSAQETYVNQHWRPQGINIVAYQGADSVVRDLESGSIDGAVALRDDGRLPASCSSRRVKNSPLSAAICRTIRCLAPGRR
ncbi:Histidine ABC transporter [Klebsiella pneumoniae subsp. rhinoscleromatis]|nr:Histidine ABC transporter [Klebsiella pneumoniae subsp. rhinoscleromatis]